MLHFLLTLVGEAKTSLFRNKSFVPQKTISVLTPCPETLWAVVVMKLTPAPGTETTVAEGTPTFLIIESPMIYVDGKGDKLFWKQ